MDKTPFELFVDWAETQTRAAQFAGRSKATINRILHGYAPLTLDVARQIEESTNGRFKAIELLGLDKAA